MPTYVAMLSWTQQGVASFKDTVDRYEQAKEAMGQLGVSFKEIYWTLGAYDIVPWSRHLPTRRLRRLCFR